MLKVAAVTMTAATAVTVSEEEVAFENYIKKFSRNYASAEEKKMRFEMFKQSLGFVVTENAKNGTSTAGLNFLSDLTQEERKQYLGYIPRKQSNNSTDSKQVFAWDGSSLATTVDWRRKNVVTPVKNQGRCGSCWAFSTTGAVEGANAIKSSSLKSFSEQQLVACSQQNDGCKDGGSMHNAIEYIQSNPLELEASYPYTSGRGRVGNCKYKKFRGVGTVGSYYDVKSGSEEDLKASVQAAPTSVAIEADQSTFQLYTKGVITSGCGDKLDHGVLAVGYGTLNGYEFFLVKNSWGQSWGQAGYVMIGSQSNSCGILDEGVGLDKLASGTIQV